MAGKHNEDVRKGDTFLRTPTYRTKATKEGINLTGATVSGDIKLNGTTVPFVCALVDAAAGRFSFGLSAGTTATLAEGKWAMQLKITFADATVKTLFTGNFVVYA